MKKKCTLFSILLLFVTQLIFAQFTRDDIRFWIGEGDSECYLAIDFRDGTTDPSFAWGIRFNAGQGLAFADLFDAVANAEPNLTYDITSGFLNDIVYNHHSGLAGQPDWWSTWSGDTSDTMTMNGGVSEPLVHERWYGTSYGFSPAPAMPTITYPAYSSLWFSADELDYAIGTGEDHTVIVIDFVEEQGSDPVTFAWKVQFDGSITSEEALLLIAENDVDFDVSFDNGEITYLSYYDLNGDAFTAYTGKDLSSWVLSDNVANLQQHDWYGIAKGSDYTRRPFIPVPAEENTTDINHFTENIFWVYPNPVNTQLLVSGKTTFDKVSVYSSIGSLIYQNNRRNTLHTSIKTEQWTPGMYWVVIENSQQIKTYKIIKQ